MSCPKMWMKSGTSKKQRYIPIHLVTAKFDNCVLSILPAFHSLTDSDTTFFLAGHTKKSCWNIFTEHYKLLSTLGKGVLYAPTNVENFICKVYKATTVLLTVLDQAFLLKIFRWRHYSQRTMPYPKTSFIHILSRQAGTLPSISVATG